MTASAPASVLPETWEPARLLPEQLDYLHSRAWMNVVVAGRRSFKTETAKRRVVMAAMQHPDPGGRFFATGPTQDQAREIFWADRSNIRDLVPDWYVTKVRHSDPPAVHLANGARIIVAGVDRPARIEGGFWDGGVITEYGNCRPDVFAEHVSPMLARGGWVDIEGVPEGRNHYYELVCAVRDGKVPGARLFEWSSEEALPLYLDNAEEVLARERSHMSIRQYEQEWLGLFVSMEGQAYYAFDPDLNVASDGRRVLYDPGLPLILCFDFNRAPGVCAYLQEHPPSRYPWVKASPVHPTITAAVGEVFIQRDSNTRKVCERVIDDWKGVHRIEVVAHGDPHGGAKGSQSVEGSDWEIINEMLGEAFSRHYHRHHPSDGNPRVCPRVNAVNSRLVAVDGSVGMVIDGKACPNLIRDFEGVEADAAGKIVKEDGSPLTHISDAVGYYLLECFPIGRHWGAPKSSNSKRSMAGGQFMPGGRA